MVGKRLTEWCSYHFGSLAVRCRLFETMGPEDITEYEEYSDNDSISGSESEDEEDSDNGGADN